MQKLIPYAVAAAIAAASFFTGSVTDIGEAVKIALNKDQAVQSCEDLIKGVEETPTE